MTLFLQPSNLLLAAVFLPLAGALWIAIIARQGRVAVRESALVTTLLTLAVTLLLIRGYQPKMDAYGEVGFNWLGKRSGVDVQMSMGLDGLSVWLFALTALLMPTAVLVSWKAVKDRPGAFYGLLLLLQTGMLGVFAARDIILFYIFFEFTLIPLFFLIGEWGSEDRRYAAVKFFLFTLAGSLLTFLGLLAIVLWCSTDGQPLTFSIAKLTDTMITRPMPAEYQLLVFVALFAGFAIKVPLFPLHTWLPLAHVQAPTAGSVILAGVLLKIGAYGFLRFSLPMLPVASAECAPWMVLLAVAGIVYGALVALAQSDIKRLIADSSVSHLGFSMLGLFALDRIALQGGALQLVNHGLSTGGLFALVGMIYERYHTREINALGGLAKRTPWLAMFLVLFTFSSIGLPGLNGFVGEFMILLGAFQRAASFEGFSGIALHYKLLTVVAVSGVVLGAWYMLWLLQRILFGPLKEPAGDHAHHAVPDLSVREILALIPLVIAMFWIGLAPSHFLNQMAPTLDRASAVATQTFDQMHQDARVTAPPKIAQAVEGERP